MAFSSEGVSVSAVALRELSAAIKGDVDTSPLACAQYSTDASNYRVPPRIVAFPRDTDDVREILRWAREYRVPVTSRGGGTSTAGNSIGEGIILEFSRYMNRIIEIDPHSRTARVQPGVVMSDLQAAAAQYGLRFGPDPSTQNRATFGGMIGNNACGPHAVAYGKTANNIQELHCIDGLGREFIASSGRQNLHETPVGDALAALVTQNLALIRTECAKFSRQVSGYSLEHLLPENGLDLAKFLVGTEGTLVTVTEATLKLVPIAAAPMLVVLGYPDMPTAADAVPSLLERKPLAIEGMDSHLVDMVRRHKGEVPELPLGEGWLMVEVGALEGEDPRAVPARAEAIARAAGTDAVMIKPAGSEASTLWRIRADGAGLGGRTPQGTQAWPGWEDSAVPPKKLGAYLRDLQALMDCYGVQGLMYGHFGDGCVHVRIDFPLDSASGVAIFREFVEAAADCAMSYGGSLSGEHGDGRARSELLTRMYSSRMMSLFSEVKSFFDPHNLLNPGILVPPLAERTVRGERDARELPETLGDVDARAAQGSRTFIAQLDENMRRPSAQELSYAGGFHFRAEGDSFTRAIHQCTGVGKCRASNAASATGWMCPSYQATKREQDVTRGRMRILQEIVQTPQGDLAAHGLLQKGFADSAVHSALDLCLGCKACGKDCPTGVDMARFKSEVLYRGYKGKLRPRTHYLLGNLPRFARIATRLPGVAHLANGLLDVTPLRKVVFALSGLDKRRQMPGFATRRFSKIARGIDGVADNVAQHHDSFSAATSQRYVMLWADSFSETLDTRGAQAMVELLQRQGYTVLIPPDAICCGLTWITTGQLDTAKNKLRHLLRVLAPFAAEGIPIVGVEPSCTAVLRDDVLDLLPDDARATLVSEMTFTLAELLTHPVFKPADLKLPDLAGTRIVAQPHCHHYSVMGWAADEALLRAAGADLEILSGCCGLAGNFGMEQGHYEVSVAVAQEQLLPALNRSSAGSLVYLADGFSCRTQAQQLANTTGVHLAQLLLDGCS